MGRLVAVAPPVPARDETENAAGVPAWFVERAHAARQAGCPFLCAWCGAGLDADACGDHHPDCERPSPGWFEGPPAAENEPNRPHPVVFKALEGAPLMPAQPTVVEVPAGGGPVTFIVPPSAAVIVRVLAPRGR